MEETKRRRFIIRAVLEGEVDVQEEPQPVSSTIAAKICGMSSAYGTDTTSAARVSTDMIPIDPSTQYTIEVPASMYLGARLYDVDGVHLGEYYDRGFGSLIASTGTATTPSNAAYIRILLKKASNDDFSSSDFPFGITINGDPYQVDNTSTISYDTLIVRAKHGGIASADGSYTSNTARAVTDLLQMTSGRSVTITCSNGYYLKAFNYRWDYNTDVVSYQSNGAIGALSSDTISGTTQSNPQQCYYRIVFKKSDNADFTEAEVLSIAGTIDGVPFTVLASEEAG